MGNHKWGLHKPRKLVRVLGRTQSGVNFTAGIEIENQECVKAAPILSWAVGRHENFLRRYFRDKGWKAMVVKG